MNDKMSHEDIYLLIDTVKKLFVIDDQTLSSEELINVFENMTTNPNIFVTFNMCCVGRLLDHDESKANAVSRLTFTMFQNSLEEIIEEIEKNEQ